MGFIYHSIFPFYSLLAFPLFLPLFCSPIISLQVCESEKGKKKSASRQPLYAKEKSFAILSLMALLPPYFYHPTLTILRSFYLKILRFNLCCVTHGVFSTLYTVGNISNVMPRHALLKFLSLLTHDSILSIYIC